MVSDLSALGAATGYGQLNTGAAQVAAKPALEPEAGPNPIAEGATEFAKVFTQADDAVTALARGEGSAQAVVEAMAQAELALQTAVTIRDRVVEAYQEILRMPV